MDTLFGSKPKAQFKIFDTISDTQRGGLDALIAQLGARSAQPYKGDFSAGMSKGEGLSLAALEERSMQMAMPGANANFDEAGNTLRSLMDFKGQTADTEGFYKTNVEQPLLERFQEEILPQISRGFGGSDFFSTERQGAEGQARGELLESLASGKERVSLDAFNQSRDRALQAAGQIPGLEGAQDARTRSMIDILDAAGLPRELAQADLDRKYQDFLRMIMQDKDMMELFSRLVLTPTKDNIGVSVGGQQGIIGDLAKAGATAYAASDRRLKTDIQKIAVINTIPFYTYRYNWDNPDIPVRIGVMADELIKKAQHLVYKDNNGYMYVNYGGLIQWLR